MNVRYHPTKHIIGQSGTGFMGQKTQPTVTIHRERDIGHTVRILSNSQSIGCKVRLQRGLF